MNATVDEGPYRDWSFPPTNVARPSLVCVSGGWSVNVGGGGRVLLNEPDDCDCDCDCDCEAARDCDVCDEVAAYAAGGRCAMAPSTPARLFDHGVGSSLPKVAGILGRDGEGVGTGSDFATGA